MNSNYTFFILFIIQIIAILVIIVSFFFNKKHPVHNIIIKLTFIADLLTCVGIILFYLLFKNEESKNIIDTTSDNNNNEFIEIQRKFSEYHNECPIFIDSLRFDFQGKNNIKYNKEDNKNAINYISNIIFQSIENYIVSSSLTKLSDSEWMCIFLSYLSSNQLKERWVVLKCNYGVQTISLINFLIAVNNKNNFKNSESLVNYCDKLIFTDEFTNIMKMKDNTNRTLK